MATLVAASLVALGPGVANADEHRPVRDVVGDVRSEFDRQQGDEVDQAPTESTGQTDVPAEQSTPTAREGASSPEKSGSRAKAQVAEVGIGDQPVADVGLSEVSIGDGNRGKSHATLLALGGQEIIGAHADSKGEGEGHAGDPLAPLCEGSEGALCLRLLFADAYADENPDRTETMSQTGAADVCVGGDNADPKEECAGPIGAKVLTSKAAMKRDNRNGATSGKSESAVADVCVGAEDGTCAVGAEVLKAESSSSSNGDAKGKSTTVGLELGNEEAVSIGDSANVDVQPECAEPSLVCVAVNEGSTTVEKGAAGATQDAVSAGFLPDTAGVDLGISRTETRATTGDVVAGAEQDRSGDGAAGGPGSPGTGGFAGAGAEVLPNTGGVWTGLLSIALAAMATGAFLIARTRRRLGAYA